MKIDGPPAKKPPADEAKKPDTPPGAKPGEPGTNAPSPSQVQQTGPNSEQIRSSTDVAIDDGSDGSPPAIPGAPSGSQNANRIKPVSTASSESAEQSPGSPSSGSGKPPGYDNWTDDQEDTYNNNGMTPEQWNKTVGKGGGASGGSLEQRIDADTERLAALDSKLVNATPEQYKQVMKEKEEIDRHRQELRADLKNRDASSSGGGTKDTTSKSDAQGFEATEEAETQMSDRCVRSIKVNGKYQCDSTYTGMETGKVVTQAVDMAGSAAVGVGAGIAMGAAQSGKMGETYARQADAMTATGVAQTTSAAVKLGFTAALSTWAGRHSGNANEIEKKAADLQKAAQEAIANKNPELAYKLQQEAANARAAILEQKKVSEQAAIGAVGMAAAAVAQGAQAGASFASAEANRKTACAMGYGEGCEKNENNSSSPPPIYAAPSGPNVGPSGERNPGTDGGNDGNTDITNAPSNLGDPRGINGGPELVNLGGPAPKTGGAGGGGGPSGGGGGGMAGGGAGGATSAAKEEETPGAKLADTKSPFYAASGSGGNAGIKGGTAGGVGMPDLAAMIAGAFGKKDEANKNPNGILAFGSGNGGPDSLLGSDVNIFARIHDAYQDKQRTNTVGLFGNGGSGRGLASQPVKRR